MNPDRILTGNSNHHPMDWERGFFLQQIEELGTLYYIKSISLRIFPHQLCTGTYACLHSSHIHTLKFRIKLIAATIITGDEMSQRISLVIFKSLCIVISLWGTLCNCPRSFLALSSMILQLNAIQNMFLKNKEDLYVLIQVVSDKQKNLWIMALNYV